ncbi:uncharacterized protein LOC118191763 isoform X2 [Stegodyphus dumicola]|uniref:uncharacterized protein LOC118191763 isoform X2 n=1 Tax=Stegodyphus dumicola TaxID=202533 RepID=UPI0015B1DB45|nr:uncharacterized protein LOC118191763 isoform X2 [Stegodyphus dumicola]
MVVCGDDIDRRRRMIRLYAIFGPCGSKHQRRTNISHRMIFSVFNFLAYLAAFLLPVASGYDQLDSFTDTLLREVMSRMASPEDALGGNFDDYGLPPKFAPQDEHDLKDFPGRAFEARRDAILGREPSIRDQEYLEHSSLFGHQYMQGGAGEGHQRLKPDGSIKNVEVVKSDSGLPAYCNPPNPCPLGYTAEDGCLEDFVNTAAFSREYQASEDCMCDSEHMFDCPGATRESEIDALARSFENEGLAEAALDRLIQSMEPTNPFLEGEKLPVVAKKTPKSSVIQ